MNQQNSEFFEKAEKAIGQLYDAAQERHELHFAHALAGEHRGAQDAGWNGADDLENVFSDYFDFLQGTENGRMKTRIAIAFYCHLSEASGFYESVKNMLRLAEGLPFHLRPFAKLVRENRTTGNAISPNSNKVLKDLAGHAKNIGMNDLAEVFRDAFDPDVRNGYAHADYVVWSDGLRLPQRNGGNGKKINYNELNNILKRGIGFFEIMLDMPEKYMKMYEIPKTICASLADEPEGNWTIWRNVEGGVFRISTS